MDLAQPLITAVWVLFVPGLPLALLLTRRCGPVLLALALSPLVSILANLVLLLTFNLAGWNPDLRLYGGVLTLVMIAATVPLMRELPDRAPILRALVPSAFVAGVALVVWRYAYRGYLLQAPNQDGMNHSFWVRRIADTGSVLWPDFFVTSSLVPVGRTPIALNSLLSSINYSQGWHASVAVAASLVGANFAAAALVSMILLWSFGMTLGLMALVRYWVPTWRYLGALAGLVAQFLPQVPGVPMTWGAIPSVVGIALLPAGFACWIWAFRVTAARAKLAAAIAFVAILFVHPPEAATLLLVGGLMVGFDALHQRRRIGLLVPLASVAVFVAGYLLVSRGQPGLFAELSGQKGRYDLQPAIEKFTSMSVQTCANALNPATCDRDFFVACALGLGIALSLIARERLTMLAGLVMMFLIFMASAAPDPYFPLIRAYTFPWYASYERTAWVAVPVVALFIAFGMYWFLAQARRYRQPVRIGLIGIAVVIGAAFFIRSSDPTLAQLRSGPVEGQVARPGSVNVFRAAKEASDRNDGIVLSPPYDAGIFGYVYEGVPASDGITGPSGVDDPVLQLLLEDPSAACSDADAAAALRRDRVSGLLLADQGIAWSGKIRTREYLASLRGWRIAVEGGGVYFLVPDRTTC